jgi:hypothetical protein
MAPPVTDDQFAAMNANAIVGQKAARVRIAVAKLANDLAREGNASAADIVAQIGLGVHTLLDRDAARLADLLADFATTDGAIAALNNKGA